MATSTSAKVRPISRSFWSYLRYLPSFIRGPLVRSKFAVEYELPSSLILKQAETEDEIRAALTLVHDAYVNLGYMDPNESRLRFSKYLALPTTVILIAKWDNEVVGTISIVADSAMGLPSETSWSIEKFRNNGNLIAEISHLSIKKDFRLRRGRLLLPLCKLMYSYCLEVLKLDGIIASTTMEVEAFYTDILLFDQLKEAKGSEHALVKGNPSLCYYLPVGDQMTKRFKSVYAKKSKDKNLYHFFCEANMTNILLPTEKNSVQSYMKQKNLALNAMIKKFPELVEKLDPKDLFIIQNLDAGQNLSLLHDRLKPLVLKQRLDFRTAASALMDGMVKLLPCQILNISEKGVQIKLESADLSIKLGTEVVLVFEVKGRLITGQLQVKWHQGQKRLGCSLKDPSDSWMDLVSSMWIEIVDQKELPATVLKKTG